MFIKDKIITNLIKNGNKRTCEIFFLKNIKLIQKETNKKKKIIIKLNIKNFKK